MDVTGVENRCGVLKTLSLSVLEPGLDLHNAKAAIIARGRQKLFRLG